MFLALVCHKAVKQTIIQSVHPLTVEHIFLSCSAYDINIYDMVVNIPIYVHYKNFVNTFTHFLNFIKDIDI